MTDRDDELAHTATAAGERSAPSALAPELGATLGRYRLEHALGEGGMGVVHAAFDPDLERRVALKVLRIAGGDEARQRLLREARAMARLTHANVVTVHEVGSVSGRDYVAMELIDGETLADWLRAAPRRPREIVAAFVAAGRGLAAAHAAGLVHRDFKPHNVLRRRDGRIVVTDFGLAREVDAPSLALATTLPLGKPTAATAHSTPSSLSGLTATGSVLGTPAYMSPEQWSGETVGPPADQFGFCVALWEALTGARPFRGQSIEALKEEVRRGPAELDASKVPRRLRSALRRGLDPDPTKRWPSMDALLAAIARAERPRLAYALAASAVAIIAIPIFVFAGHDPAREGDGCPVAARDPGSVWSLATRVAMVVDRREPLATAFTNDVAAWRDVRAHACASPTELRATQLACLDGVLARLDAVRRAADSIKGTLAADGIIGELVEPRVCLVATPPRLTIGPTPDVIDALASFATADEPDHKTAEADTNALATKPGLDACAHAIALLAFNAVTKDVPKARAAANEAVGAAEQCGDDRLRADTLIVLAPFQFEQPLVGPRGEDAVKRAKIAIDRVAQPDLTAALDLLRAAVASQQDRKAQALELTAHAIDSYGARGEKTNQLGAVLVRVEALGRSHDRGDLEEERALIAKWRPVANALHDHHKIRALDYSDAYARLFLGDVAGGHAELLRLWKVEKQADMATRRIEGTVVDREGHPVHGAVVAAARTLFADSIGIPFPFSPMVDDLRSATTDSNGHFVMEDGSPEGAIMAQLGDRRSVANAISDHVKLVLEPTRRLSGRVVLGVVAPTQVLVMGEPLGRKTDSYRFITALQPDGTFSIDGAPIEALQLGAAVQRGSNSTRAEFKQIAASSDNVSGIELAVTTSQRTLDVVARSSVSTPLDSAQILLFPGRVQIKDVGELISRVQQGGFHAMYGQKVIGEAAPKTVIDKLRDGDLIAHFADVGPGELTACAIGLNGDLSDPKIDRQIQEHVRELQLKCEHVAPADQAVVVEAPPQKRFD